MGFGWGQGTCMYESVWPGDIGHVAIPNVNFSRTHTQANAPTYVGPLALTNDKIYGLSNVNGPASRPL